MLPFNKSTFPLLQSAEETNEQDLLQASERSSSECWLRNDRQSYLHIVQQLLNAQQFAFNKNTEGKVVDLLVERTGGRVGQMAGRSPYMQAVNFIGEEDQIGQIVSCRLSAARQKSMTGEIVSLKVVV